MFRIGTCCPVCPGRSALPRPYRPYLWVLAPSGLATLLNPYGMQYWYYIIQAISMPRPQIIEWGSIYQLYRTGLISSNEVINLAAMIILVLFLAWRNKWRELTPALCLVVTIYIGLTHIRHMVFCYLLVGAYIPVLCTPYFDEIKSHGKLTGVWNRLSRLPGLILALIAVFIGLLPTFFSIKTL